MCIARYPRCGGGAPATSSDGTPFGKIGGTIASIIAIIGGITAALALLGSIHYIAGGIILGGTVASNGTVTGGIFLGAAGAAAISAALAAIATIIVIGFYVSDRCTQGSGGNEECLSGVVREIISSFSSTLDEIFPFTAMHNRVDIVVRSQYWDLLEGYYAYVFCTEDSYPRQSEILRAYYFTNQVCNAAKGALIGGIAGAVPGIILGALAAAAIGCATIILCIFAIILAAIIAGAAVLAGALAGGQIAKATSDSSVPTDSSGNVIPTGALLSVRGYMKRRDNDSGANVLWWVSNTEAHGTISSSVHTPYSYCDLELELPFDSCPTADPQEIK